MEILNVTKIPFSYPKAGLSALLSGVFTRPPAVEEELELRFNRKAIDQAPGSGTGALLLEVRALFFNMKEDTGKLGIAPFKGNLIAGDAGPH